MVAGRRWLVDGRWQMVFDKQSVVDDGGLTLEVLLLQSPMAFDSLSAVPLRYFQLAGIV